MALGPAKRRRRVSPQVSPMATPITSAGVFWLLGSLRSRAGRWCCAASPPWCAPAHRAERPRQNRDRSQPRTGRARRASRCRLFLRGQGILFAVERPGKVRVCGGANLRPRDRVGRKLFHVAQAGGPLNERAHRRAIARHPGVDRDDVARIEMEGLTTSSPLAA